MIEKQTGNNIDEIFRKGIENLNTEPSDDFWRKTADNIIKNGKTTGNNNAARWRALALFLGAILLVLGYFTIKMQSSIEKTYSKTVATKNSVVDNGAIQTAENNNAGKPITPKAHATTAAGSNNEIQQTSTANNRPTAFVVSKKDGAKQTSTTVKYKSASVEAAVTRGHKKVKTSKSEQLTNMVVPANLITKKTTAIPFIQESKTTMPDVVSNNSIVPELKSSSQNAVPVNTKTESASFASNQIKANPIQSVSPPDTSKKSVVTDIAVPSSGFSIWAYYSPHIVTGYNYKSSGTAGSYYENKIKTSEKAQSSYSAGMNVEYELTKRLSVSAGLSYQYYSLQIGPTYLYAQQEPNGQLGYSIVSSSGIVYCPYYGYYTVPGDSLKMSAKSTRTYLSIPIQLKYFILKTDKVSLFVTGGIRINISTGTETIMNWEDSWNNQGISNVNTIEGLQTIYYSYTFGIGSAYNFTKHMGIYAEPTLQGSLTAINKSTPVVSYPYLFGLNAGLTYHF